MINPGSFTFVGDEPGVVLDAETGPVGAASGGSTIPGVRTTGLLAYAPARLISCKQRQSTKKEKRSATTTKGRE